MDSPVEYFPLGFGRRNPTIAEGILTNAQISTIDIAPIVLIPAPAAGFCNIPVYWQIQIIKSLAYGGTTTLNLRYTGVTLLMQTNLALTLNVAPENRIAGTPARALGNFVAAPPFNLGIEVFGTGAPGAIGDATIRWAIDFYTMRIT